MGQFIEFVRFFVMEFLPGNVELVAHVAAIVIAVTYAGILIALGVAVWRSMKEDQ